jgi:hypothetical protein
VAGCFERGDELSGSMKYGDFLCLAKESLASQTGLCSMELLADIVLNRSAALRSQNVDVPFPSIAPSSCN